MSTGLLLWAVAISRPLCAAAPCLVALSLCACVAGESARDEALAAPPTLVSSTTAAVPLTLRPVSNVTVIFSDHVRELAAKDSRLSADGLVLALQQRLGAQQLYQPARTDLHRTLVVTVESFTDELASNTRLAGFTARNLQLVAEVQVKDAAQLSQPFDVHARVRQSHRDGSFGTGSLDELYARLAAQTLEDLRAIAAPAAR